MNPRAKRSIAWTVGLVLLLSIAVVFRFDWLVLLIPGTILMWYGAVASTPTDKNAVRNRSWSGLN